MATLIYNGKEYTGSINWIKKVNEFIIQQKVLEIIKENDGK